MHHYCQHYFSNLAHPLPLLLPLSSCAVQNVSNVSFPPNNAAHSVPTPYHPAFAQLSCLHLFLPSQCNQIHHFLSTTPSLSLDHVPSHLCPIIVPTSTPASSTATMHSPTTGSMFIKNGNKLGVFLNIPIYSAPRPFVSNALILCSVHSL